MAHILAIRFSALGDVAMTVPVIQSFARRYPQHEITVLSREMASPLFRHMPENVHFLGVNLRHYRGMGGLWRLFCMLRRQSFDVVVALHSVLRSIFLRTAYRLCGVPTSHLSKGRCEKWRLTRRRHKVLRPLKPSTQRYADCFAQSGYPVDIDFHTIYDGRDAAARALPDGLDFWDHEKKHIGIAPFAAHELKAYPLALMKEVIGTLARMTNIQLLLFGAGEAERAQCETWATAYESVHALVGRYELGDELCIMSHLDVMLTMDSANMHLAALTGTPTVSIWGPTHPYAGFAGCPAKGSVQIGKTLTCRPCSIFGNKPCRRGDHACMCEIAPQEVVESLKVFIENENKES